MSALHALGAGMITVAVLGVLVKTANIVGWKETVKAGVFSVALTLVICCGAYLLAMP